MNGMRGMNGMPMMMNQMMMPMGNMYGQQMRSQNAMCMPNGSGFFYSGPPTNIVSFFHVLSYEKEIRFCLKIIHKIYILNTFRKTPWTSMDF